MSSPQAASPPSVGHSEAAPSTHTATVPTSTLPHFQQIISTSQTSDIRFIRREPTVGTSSDPAPVKLKLSTENLISTGKYTILTFPFKFFKEQFSKYANLFFLLTACIQVSCKGSDIVDSCLRLHTHHPYSDSCLANHWSTSPWTYSTCP